MKVIILFTGLVRNESHFLDQLSKVADLESFLDGIVFSTWKGELDKYPELSNELNKYNVKVIESDPPNIIGVGHIYHQQKCLRAGLDYIGLNNFVLKGRPDLGDVSDSLWVDCLKGKVDLNINNSNWPNIFNKKIVVKEMFLLHHFYINDINYFGLSDDIYKLTDSNIQIEFFTNNISTEQYLFATPFLDSFPQIKAALTIQNSLYYNDLGKAFEYADLCSENKFYFESLCLYYFILEHYFLFASSNIHYELNDIEMNTLFSPKSEDCFNFLSVHPANEKVILNGNFFTALKDNSFIPSYLYEYEYNRAWKLDNNLVQYNAFKKGVESINGSLSNSSWSYSKGNINFDESSSRVKVISDELDYESIDGELQFYRREIDKLKNIIASNQENEIPTNNVVTLSEALEDKHCYRIDLAVHKLGVLFASSPKNLKYQLEYMFCLYEQGNVNKAKVIQSEIMNVDLPDNYLSELVIESDIYAIIEIINKSPDSEKMYEYFINLFSKYGGIDISEFYNSLNLDLSPKNPVVFYSYSSSVNWLHCAIPKNANTLFKNVIGILDGVVDQNIGLNIHQHGISNCIAPKHKSINSKTIKTVVLREPKSRLVSAYFDKVVNWYKYRDDRTYPQFVKRAQFLLGMEINIERGVTLYELVCYLEKEENFHYLDEHLLPQCLYLQNQTFDMYIKLEDIFEKTKALSTLLKIDPSVWNIKAPHKISYSNEINIENIDYANMKPLDLFNLKSLPTVEDMFNDELSERVLSFYKKDNEMYDNA